MEFAVIRSRGYDESKEPKVKIELQLAEGTDLNWKKVYSWIRKIRRRYGNTSGVEYMVEVNLPDQ